VIRAVAARLGKEPKIEEGPRRPGDPASLVADPSALFPAVSWRPTHSSIEEIVDSAVSWEEWRRSVD
jgi:UDP-glucose 4-epimerase